MNRAEVIRRGRAQGLTARQALFGYHYLDHGNGARAARQAGYEPSRAHVTGAELVANRNIQDWLAELAGDTEAAKQLSGEHVIAMLLREAQTCETDGARIRAQELLGKAKRLFVDRIETDEAGDGQLVVQLRAVLGADAGPVLQALGATVADATPDDSEDAK